MKRVGAREGFAAAIVLLRWGTQALRAVFRSLEWGTGRTGWRARVFDSGPLVALCALATLWIAVRGAHAEGPPPLPAVQGTSFVDWMLSTNDHTYVRWMETAKGYALGLFAVLLPIQFVLSVGPKAMQEGVGGAFHAALDLTIRKGAWAYFITHAVTLAPGIYQDLGYYGATVAGSALEGAPRQFQDIGATAFHQVVKVALANGILSLDGAGFIAVIGGFLMYVVFALAGWVLGLTLAYFKFVSAGGLILLGLTALDSTSRYGWKYIEFCVRGGLKQVGVILVLGLCVQYVPRWTAFANYPVIGEPLTALRMLTDMAGALLMFLVVPNAISSAANGTFADSGEGRVGGMMAGVAGTAASVGTAWALSRFLAPSATAGATGGGAGAPSAESKQAAVANAYASTAEGVPGPSDGGGGAAAPSWAGSAVAGPQGGSSSAGSTTPGWEGSTADKASKQVGQAARAAMQGARGRGAQDEGDDDE